MGPTRLTGQLLVIDRWTGLEGVMATVAYPEKSLSLLDEAATKRRTYGTVDVYTRKISGSSFDEENAKTYHFASLAGPIAFFYFSGSLAVVFAGMAFIAVLMSAIELFWRCLVRDDLLVAMSGLYLALIVMQFSGGVDSISDRHSRRYRGLSRGLEFSAICRQHGRSSTARGRPIRCRWQGISSPPLVRLPRLSRLPALQARHSVRKRGQRSDRR